MVKDKEPRVFFYASIYARRVGSRAVEWEDGPLELTRAREQLDAWVASELEDSNADGFNCSGGPGSVMYYELRGLDGCPVRYRVWIEQPKAYARVEELSARRAPGRSTKNSGL